MSEGPGKVGAKSALKSNSASLFSLANRSILSMFNEEEFNNLKIEEEKKQPPAMIERSLSEDCSRVGSSDRRNNHRPHLKKSKKQLMSVGQFLPQASSQVIRLPGRSRLIQSPQQSQRSAYEILVSVQRESEYEHEPEQPEPVPAQPQPAHERLDEQERKMVEEIMRPSPMQN